MSSTNDSEYEYQIAAARYCAVIAAEREVIDEMELFGRRVADDAGREIIGHLDAEKSVQLVERLIGVELARQDAWDDLVARRAALDSDSGTC